MSRKADGNGWAILEGVGLGSNAIKACFSKHPVNEEEAVQAELVKWTRDQGYKPHTWQVLLEAMEYAEFSQQYIQDLKKELGLFGVLFCINEHCQECCVPGVCMRACVCVHWCLHVCVCACVCVCVCVANHRGHWRRLAISLFVICTCHCYFMARSVKLLSC